MMNFLRTCVLACVASAVMVVSGVTGGQAQSSYRLAPGDQLRFEVLEDGNLNRNLLIAPDGRIAVPLIGTVQAGGLTLDGLRASLTQRLASSFAAPPTVFVALESRPEARAPAAIEPIAVFVLGEAQNTGRLQVPPGTTMLEFLAQMGGFTNFAAQRRIQLRRGDTIWNIDYRAIERGQSNAGAVELVDGDIIIVPQRRLFE